MSPVETDLAFQTSLTVRLNFPIDEIADPRNALNNTVEGATCAFTVYDREKDEVLSAAEATSQTDLSVTNASVFKVGDQAEVELDDGTRHIGGVISAVDPTAGTITVPTGLASAAALGNRVRVQLGPIVTMTEYGTPSLSKLKRWGFQGPLASTHGGLVLSDPRQRVIITRRFTSSVGNVPLSTCHVVKPLEDCEGLE